ncbi:hypothetical protein D9M68_941740 [compost metagenome]
MAFDRSGRLLAKIEFGVDVIFDERCLILLNKRVKVLFFCLGHGRAERILQATHKPAGLDRQFRQAIGKHVEFDSLARVNWNLDGLQLESFQYLQGGVKGGRLDRHQVARPGYGL